MRASPVDTLILKARTSITSLQGYVRIQEMYIGPSAIVMYIYVHICVVQAPKFEVRCTPTPVAPPVFVKCEKDCLDFENVC